MNRDLWEANVRGQIARAIELLGEVQGEQTGQWKRTRQALIRDLRVYLSVPRDGAPDMLKDPLLEALVERQSEIVRENRMLKGLVEDAGN